MRFFIESFAWAIINFCYCSAIYNCPNHSPVAALMFLLFGIAFLILGIFELHFYIGRRKK